MGSARRLLLLGAALAALGVAHARKCGSQRDYECVGKKTFCLGGMVMRCAPGTLCTGSKDGDSSPCTWGRKRDRCHGPYNDNECCESKAFCLKGHKMSCPEGTKCRGSRHGETPCKYRKPKGHTQKHPVPDKAKCDCDCSHDDCKDCDHCQDDHRRSCDDCRDSCDHPDCKYCKRCREERCDCDCGDDDCHCRTCGKSQPSCDDCDCDDDECQHCDKCDWGEECPGGKDNVCTSSNSYCHGGRNITCPLDYVCHDFAPCVKRAPCPDGAPDGRCGELGDFQCLNHRDFCRDGECFSCPDGTKCTGSSPGSSGSPCTADEAPPPCPGLYGDFQCIDARRYCLDGATITCPRSGWCHGNAGESPCKSTPPPEEQSCTVKNNACIDFKSYCSEGFKYKCPSDTICKGGFPCSIQPDDTCEQSDNTCLTSSDYCLGGERLTCPEGYRCSNTTRPGQSPCVAEAGKDAPRCWTSLDDYTCFDNSHYCLGGNSVWCGSSKWCIPGAAAADKPICQSEPPKESAASKKCTQDEWTCVDDSSFCHKGRTFECPEDTVCKGKSPFPCVQRCSCATDGPIDPNRKSGGPCDCDCEKPECHCPQCPKYEDCWCDCADAECAHCPFCKCDCDCGEARCAERCSHCHDQDKCGCECGQRDCWCSHCRPSDCDDTCWDIKRHGGCRDENYACLGYNKYCKDREVFCCPDGTRCSGAVVPGQGSCCQPNGPTNSCGGPYGNYGCIDSRAYCINGYRQECPAGTTCVGSISGESPCKATPVVPNIPTVPPCYGEGVCCSDYEYCSGGRKFSCPGGSLCERSFPCVWATERLWDEPADPCSRNPWGPGCSGQDTLDMSSRWQSMWPSGLGEGDGDCNCADPSGGCYRFCCEFPGSSQCQGFVQSGASKPGSGGMQPGSPLMTQPGGIDGQLQVTGKAGPVPSPSPSPSPAPLTDDGADAVPKPEGEAAACNCADSSGSCYDFCCEFPDSDQCYFKDSDSQEQTPPSEEPPPTDETTPDDTPPETLIEGEEELPPPEGELPPPEGELPPPEGELPPPEGELLPADSLGESVPTDPGASIEEPPAEGSIEQPPTEPIPDTEEQPPPETVQPPPEGSTEQPPPEGSTEPPPADASGNSTDVPPVEGAVNGTVTAATAVDPDFCNCADPNGGCFNPECVDLAAAQAAAAAQQAAAAAAAQQQAARAIVPPVVVPPGKPALG